MFQVTYLLWTSVAALKSQSGKKLPGREVPVASKKKKKKKIKDVPSALPLPTKNQSNGIHPLLTTQFKKKNNNHTVERKCTTPCCRVKFSACSYMVLCIYTAQSYSINDHNYVLSRMTVVFVTSFSVEFSATDTEQVKTDMPGAILCPPPRLCSASLHSHTDIND